MNTKVKYTILSAVIGVLCVSCDSFLDQAPDNRVEWNSPSQISDLLVSAYSGANYALMCELSSDNFVDNNSPDPSTGAYYNLNARERWYDEIFAWKDIVTAGSEQDTPSYVWSACYQAIAVANSALEAIKKLEDAGRGNEVTAQKGEALLSRAYHHFILVNIFAKAYRNDELSKQDIGIPYVTEPETTVFVDYDRTTVTDVYQKIEKDLLEGLPLIADGYNVPKYHFNTKAAHAFAARFYLFKRNYQQVIANANQILGADASQMMRDWNHETPTGESLGHWYINATSNDNLLLVSTGSWFSRVFGSRYSCNRDAAKATIYGTGPTWDNYNFHPCYDGRLFYRGQQEYGLFFMKAYEFFEYTDKIAGIGLGHIVRAEFTAEETLLCRAEAYLLSGQKALAIADLKTWDESRRVIKNTLTMEQIPNKDLTETIIRTFYTKNTNEIFRNAIHTTEMSPDFVVNTNDKPILDCILHFRRLETIFDGMRWFDIKRFGIEISHRVGKSTPDVLKWDDPRRALQLPPEVVVAGLTPNERLVLGVNNAYVDVHSANVSYLK
ncbi:MAG: RagB/SusD family nutrient uptake outer membrane protein [Prevotellaceae bacterium]|jgi:hypothetical protein|nr:RagB/SusD family nutrient uptake outer membrane protein [Prevotellaceae bacterium]